MLVTAKHSCFLFIRHFRKKNTNGGKKMVSFLRLGEEILAVRIAQQELNLTGLILRVHLQPHKYLSSVSSIWHLLSLALDAMPGAFVFIVGFTVVSLLVFVVYFTQVNLFHIIGHHDVISDWK